MSFYVGPTSGRAVSRRTAIKGIGGIIAAATLPGSSSAEPTALNGSQARVEELPKRPNILWITGEEVPMAALSCYGSGLIHTPNIDRIANEGMRFTNSFVTNGLCAPNNIYITQRSPWQKIVMLARLRKRGTDAYNVSPN